MIEGDLQGRSDLIQSVGWMDSGMDGGKVIDG
jgi:hypothetical protein